ncbi:acyl-CoA dehydrogenase family protein [Amycolatopsis sp. NPDC051071]|uniref:acyl-CoA dehydrogenase family protein n=1 Tax=Amycolatopsis sp. NPDC051071 TaxID=3154637 RepID=UPI0034421E48
MSVGAIMNAVPVGLPVLQGISENHAEWTARLDKIAPVIIQHRNSTEDDRSTAPEVVDALREQGFHRMWISRSFGGGGVPLVVGMGIVQALARLDASIAWQMGVQGAIGRLSDYLPESTASLLFREHDKLVVGGVNPSGKAVPVEGGYRLTGRWAFASGSAHADWLVCAALITENGIPRKVAGAPVIRMLFVPRDVVHFEDDWYTIGLRGTGSVSYTLEDVFVPEEFTVDGAAMHHPPADRPSRGYPVSYFDFGPFTSSSTALGIAQDALETFKSLATSKTPAGASSTLAASHTVQEKLARMEMQVYTARVLLSEAASQVTERGEDGGKALTALVRLTAAAVAEHAMAAVDLAYQLAGTSSLYATSRLERSLRDVRSAVKHITLSHTHFEMVGQYLLGGELLVRR